MNDAPASTLKAMSVISDGAGRGHAVAPHPRLAIVAEQAPTPGHGTGAVLGRHLSFLPRNHKLSVFQWGHPDETMTMPVQVPPLLWSTGRLRVPPISLRHPRAWTGGLAARRALRQRLSAFQPDLLLSIAFSSLGLEMVAFCARVWPTVPIVFKLWDLELGRSPEECARIVRPLLPRTVAVKCLTPAMAPIVRTIFQREPEIDDILCCEIFPEARTVHRNAADGLAGVIFGNFWTHQMVDDVAAVWRRVQAALPGAKPLRWICHPESLVRLSLTPQTLPAEIRHAGFFPSYAELHRELVAADFALVPFNREDAPETNYARFSFPSRMAEICAAGLPTFAVAGRQTGLARWLEHRGVGVASPAVPLDACVDALVAFARNQPLRATLSRTARALAVERFELGRFQQRLSRELAAYCRDPAVVRFCG